MPSKFKEAKKKQSRRGTLDTSDRKARLGRETGFILYAGYVSRDQAVRAAKSLRTETKGTKAFVKKNPKKLEPYEVWVKHFKPFWGKKGGGMTKFL